MSSRRVPLSPLSFWHQKRMGRETYQPFADYVAGDIYFDIDALAIDPRNQRLMNERIFDMGEDRPRHYGRETEKGGRKREQTPTPPGYRSTRFRPTMAMQGKDGGSFTGALKKLHKQLGKAEDLYNNFQTDYDNDMSTIKNYATLEQLDQLWVRRVLGKKDRRTLQDGDGHSEDENAGEKPKQKFEEMASKLNQAMEAVQHSAVKTEQSSSKARARREAGERLQEKVHIASLQISPLLKTVTKSYDDCIALLNEVKLLRNLVDPESEVNKDVFKSADDGEDQGSDDGDDQQDRGRDWDE